MKILWIDLNSSYAHSSLALPALHAQIKDKSPYEWEMVSATINENVGMVVERIVAYQPDIIAATMWLFNHEQLLHITSRAKALLPKACLILGGPEFLGENETFLRCNPFVDAVFRGEGEEHFPQWLSCWDNPTAWATIDGLCYLDADGKLRGFRVNRVEGNHLFLADPVEIHPGTPLYRSFDQGWERMMSKPTAARVISLDWHMKDVEDGFLLSVKREDGLTLERMFQWEHQQAKPDQMDNIRQLLSKLGETHYTSRSVEVNFSQPWFVPRSQLSAWRRDIIELLDSKVPKRISQAHEMCIMSPKDKVKAFNVSNRLAAQAYEEAGLTHWKPAMEADSPNGSPVLMECRYCLRYELGLCPKKQQAKVSYKLPLYLKLQDGRKFALQFDCAHCKMYVLNEDSK